MSYDLVVFLKENPASRLSDLIAAEADLAVEIDGARIVVKRGRGLYCCSIGEAVPVEVEDLPDELASLSLPVRFQVDINVEGSAPAAIERTRKLVRHIARALDAVSWDQQTGACFPRPARRRAARVPAPPVDLVKLDWYTAQRDGVAEAYLNTSRRHLPVALPRRFGPYEPFTYRLERDGDDRFIREVADDHMLFFDSAAPVDHGSITQSDERGARVCISILAASLNNEVTRLAVRAFFVDLARQLDCFFASAQLIRNVRVGGWPLPEGRTTDMEYSTFWRDGWMGLPPHPIWWTYFGSHYAQLIDPRTVGVTHDGSFAFMELSMAPADRDALAANLPRRGLLRRRARWIDPALQMKALVSDPNVSPPRAERARVVPGQLGVKVAAPGYRI